MDYSSIQENVFLASQRSHIEDHEKWSEIADEMPYLKFDSDWEIKIYPPFGGAFIRFDVKQKSKVISVYYDPCFRLGYHLRDKIPTPYYAMYPDIHGHQKRFAYDETDKLIEYIRYVFNNWRDELYRINDKMPKYSISYAE